MNIAKSICRLKSQIYEKQKLIDEHIQYGSWNDEWRAKEFQELNTFYDAYHALLAADDTIKDLKLESKKEQNK
tara:strand:+ start:200 stop:418 length:219 start_codon:yes stop_codon:yes gene_type:complete